MRAFLQERTSLWARLWIVLLVGFLALGQTAQIRTHAPMPSTIIEWLAVGQLVNAFGFAAIWLRTRAGRRTEAELRFYEAAGTIAPLALVSGVFWFAPPVLRPEAIVLMAFSNALMARAVIIPSTARRTLVLGVCPQVVFVIGTYVYYVTRAPHGTLPPLVFALIAFAGTSASVVISTVASHTIFGLRQRVREVTELGQYRLEQKLGEGGMGIVYRASHLLLRRPTAIKLLPPSKTLPQDILRFEREVQLTSLLTHPNTIAIYDYGRTPDGIFYYAMEFVDGVDLQELVEGQGPQPPACVAHIVAQICGALDEAHSVGLIHRDVKPANVILCERGRVPGFAKVVDFGLVKSVESSPDELMLSKADAILGTPLYLSPEAIVSPSSVNHLSDIYAVGALAYFLLTGTDVFRGRSVVEVCSQHLYETPESPSSRLGVDLPEGLEALVLECLAKGPAARPQSADVVARRLRELPCWAEWTDERAASWWAEIRKAHPAVRDRRTTATPQTAKPTIAIDLQERKKPR